MLDGPRAQPRAYFTNDHKVYVYRVKSNLWTDLPPCRHKNFGVAMVKQRLTALGGVNPGTNSNTNIVLSFTEKEGEGGGGKWEELLPPMPTGRIYPAAMTMPTHLVVACGMENRETDRETVDLMALDSLQWTNACSCPQPIRYPQLKHTTSGHLFLADTESSRIYACSLERLLKSSTDAAVGGIVGGAMWSRKADIPVTQGASVASCGRCLLAVGGVDVRGQPVGTVHRYSVEEDRWEVEEGGCETYPRFCSLSAVCAGAGGESQLLLLVVGGFEAGWNECNVTQRIPLPVSAAE